MGVSRGARAGIARGLRTGVRGGSRGTGRLVRNIGEDLLGTALGGGGRGRGGEGESTDVDQTIEPVNVRVIEGFASAVKGATGEGGGGAIVPFGSSPLTSRESTAITKTDDPVVDRLDEIKRILQRMLELERESLESVRNQVLNFARSSEQDARTSEQDQQETTKKESDKAEKNPIVKKATKAFGGIFDFLKNLVVTFVKYKILDWLSKPENKKLIQGTIQFFMNVVKLFQILHEKFIGPFTKLITSLLGGGLNIFMDLIKVAVDLISLKWLTNPKEFIDGILNIPKTLLKVIPDILSSLVNFLTFGLADVAGRIIQDGIKNLFGLGGDKKEQETEGSNLSPAGQPPAGEQKPNPIAQAGNAIKGAVSTILNPVGAIANMVGGLFGSGQQDKPQLKEGGVVGPNKGGSGVSVEPLDKITQASGIFSSIKKTSKMFMSLLTMPFRLMGAALIALTMNTIGKIPGVGPFIKPLLQNIISKFDLPSSIANVLEGKTPEKKEEKNKPSTTKPSSTGGGNGGSPSTTQGSSSASSGDTGNLYSMLTGKQSPLSTDSSTSGGDESAGGSTSGSAPSGPAPAGSLNYDQLKNVAKGAGFNDADASRMAAIAMAESSGNPKAHNSTPPDNSYGLWQINMIGNLGPARRKQLGISSNEQLFDPVTNAKAAKLIKDSQGWNAWTVHKTGAYKKFMPSKKEGGWITGPQSGYPVSLDGGKSTSFIGHGTEWVGFKKASGGSVSSAFVIPFDTPSTRSNGGLVGRRMKEAKNGGYALPFASGGVVKTDGVWDTGPGYTVQGATDQQGRPIVFSQSAANAFAQMMTASGGRVKGSDVASSKRSPAKNRSVGGATNSKHMHGIAMDIHGSSGSWIRQNGAKYGWIANDYPGSHGGHFEFKGAGIPPSDSSNQGNQDGTKPDTAGSNAPGGGGGATATPTLSMDMLKELNMMLTGGASSVAAADIGTNPLTGLSFNPGTNLDPATASILSNVPNYSTAFNALQTENLVSTAFTPTNNGTTIINSPGKTETSVNQTIDTNSLGATLPKDGNWSIFKTNL
jgi:hypothetical protein